MSTQRWVEQIQKTFGELEGAGFLLLKKSARAGFISDSVNRSQRFPELPGSSTPTSRDAGPQGPKQQFGRASNGLTASAFPVLGKSALATNSLSFSSRCVRRAGQQLPSPPVASEQELGSARTMQSVLPQVLMSDRSRTERQHDQGNLYLQHAARNAAGNFGRRSARRDLLRA